MSVTDDQIKQFSEDGAILLKNIFRSRVSKLKIVVISDHIIYVKKIRVFSD